MAWNVKCETLKDCPLAKQTIPIIFQMEDMVKVKALLKKYPDKEWLMYLYGDVTREAVQVTGMSIPKQEVTGGSVDNIEAPLPGCIGTIHSHNSMGAFHSGTDETYIQNNHTVCITVNNKLEFAATIDVLSECNRPMRLKADVRLVEPEVDLTNFLKDAEENISEKKSEYQSWYNGNYASIGGMAKKWNFKEGRWEEVTEEKKNGDKNPEGITEDRQRHLEKYAEALESYWGM